MQRMGLRLVALGLAGTLSSGCATVIHQTKQKVDIASTPVGATVKIDGLDHGVTPLVVKLRRKENHLVRLELAGYQPYEVTLTKEISGWLFGNILIGGLIGVGVDALTGSMYKLTPKQIDAELKAAGQAAANGDGVYVAVVLQPKAGWEKIGQLTPIPLPAS